MPAEFTKQFAKSLDNQCNISVSEAVSSEILRIGHAYVAKGGKHLIIAPNSKYTIELSDTAPVNFVRPSVDVTLESVAKSYGNKATAIILTGMGSDGRSGARQIKQQGGIVIAEDKSTAVLFGMPRAVIEAGLNVGARAVFLAKEPILAAIGAGVPINTCSGNRCIFCQDKGI